MAIKGSRGAKPQQGIEMPEAQSETASPPPAIATEDTTTQGPAVVWDDSRMVTHFANVVNIQSTLEQVDLFFGTNQTWNLPSDRRVQVELNNRIILSPHAAKRLWLALGGVLQSYESRHGELRVEGR